MMPNRDKEGFLTSVPECCGTLMTAVGSGIDHDNMPYERVRCQKCGTEKEF